jgi:hypothetical protein
MNPLLSKSAYLAGAIDSCTEDGATLWRRAVSQILWAVGAKSLDPTTDSFKEYIESHEDVQNRHGLLKDGEFDRVSYIMSHIRKMDIDAVLKSDFLIARLTEEYRACGTYDEIFTAARNKIPVVIWYEKEKYNLPHWLFGCLNHQYFFSSIQEVEQFLFNSERAHRFFEYYFDVPHLSGIQNT